MGSEHSKPLALPTCAACAVVWPAMQTGRQEAACAPWLMLPLSLLHCQLVFSFWAFCYMCLVEEHAVNEWLRGGQSGDRAESGESMRHRCCSCTACRCAALLAPAHEAAFLLLCIVSMSSTLAFIYEPWIIDLSRVVTRTALAASSSWPWAGPLPRPWAGTMPQN